MKTTKTISRLFVLAICAFGLPGCNQQDETPNEEIHPLQKTTWQLLSFVDVANQKQYRPEYFGFPNTRYTLNFGTDKTFSGHTFSNSISGIYEVDFKLLTLKLTCQLMTEVTEFFDGKVFLESLNAVQSFTVIADEELKLYYNDQKNYLLFVPIEKNEVEFCCIDYIRIKIEDIFEVKYGEEVTRIIQDRSLTFSIQDVTDKEVYLHRIFPDGFHETIVIDFQHAWAYNDDGSDIQEVADSIAKWQSEHAQKGDFVIKFSKEFHWGTFVDFYEFVEPMVGVGVWIRLAKVYPTVPAAADQYKFIFIITEEN
jgi:heat shock protein HslJ